MTHRPQRFRAPLTWGPVVGSIPAGGPAAPPPIPEGGPFTKETETMATKKNTAPAPVDYSQAFRNALRAVLLAASEDESRPHMTRVEIQWRTPMGVMLTCTDGHRLHVATVETPAGCSIDVSEAPAVGHYVPKALLSALPTKGPAGIRVDKGGAVHVNRAGASVIVHREACDAFPPWNQLLSRFSEFERAATVGLNPSYLAEAAEASRLVVGSVGGCEFVTRGELDFVTLSTKRDGNTFLAIVMPMRIDSGAGTHYFPAEIGNIREASGRTVEAVPAAAE